VWTKRDSTAPERLKIGRYLTGLLRTLGYRATLRALDPDSFYAYVGDSRHRAQIGVAAWVPDVPSGASSFFEPVLTCNSYEPATPTNSNFAGYCDPRVDAEIRRAERLELTNPAAASALWTKIDRRVGKAAPWVPLYNVRMTDVLSTRVGNYLHNPMFGFLLGQAWVK
jgi:peptide/nickel transport system substrate-binding protein